MLGLLISSNIRLLFVLYMLIPLRFFFPTSSSHSSTLSFTFVVHFVFQKINLFSYFCIYISFSFIFFAALFIYIRGGYTLTLLPMRDEIAKYQKIRMKSGTKGKWERSFHHHITVSKQQQQQKNEKKFKFKPWHLFALHLLKFTFLPFSFKIYLHLECQ